MMTLPDQGDEPMSHKNGMADRSKSRQPLTTVLFAMIVVGPTGVTAPKHSVLSSMPARPEVIGKSAAERDIVNEEPADGTPPVMSPGEAPVASEAVPPAAPDAEAREKPESLAPSQDPAEPRYLGVVNQDGDMKAIFQ